MPDLQCHSRNAQAKATVPVLQCDACNRYDPLYSKCSTDSRVRMCKRYLAIANDYKVWRLWGEGGGQPVEESVAPHQAHGGGADDQQRPVLRVARRNADGL